MKKRLTLMLAVGALVALMTPGVASADPDGTDPNAASLLRGTGCNIVGVDGSPNYVGEYLSVSNHGGLWQITCRGEVDNPVGRALHFDQENGPLGGPLPFFCNLPGYPAQPALGWQEIISASGMATLKIRCT